MSNHLSFILILSKKQKMICFSGESIFKEYHLSTGKNGLGEINGSGCTPRGWHRVYSIIGMGYPQGSVFCHRKATGEVYNDQLNIQYPERDWILSRIIQLDGMEVGRNKGGCYDSLQRYIYIHGTPEIEKLGQPASHGCVRMACQDVIEVASWITLDTLIYIE
ncbi:MAG: L,D-transpeptidase family protein [Legionella sp.]